MISKISVAVLLLCLIILAIFTLRPPGKAELPQMEQPSLAPELLMDSGKLPGITWADDIHPIFVRNECSSCHTRGREDVVEGLNQFALGIIDSGNSANPYFSYRELVYTQLMPQILDGETLRDGQCCWPRNYPEDQQRRIWLGHPERSALLRKLERDYYDWNSPPRFFGEGLRLSWGLPMPLWREGEAHVTKHDTAEVQEDHHGEVGEHKPVAQKQQDHGHKDSSYSTSIWKTMAFRTTLWLGVGRHNLKTLPPPIPALDRNMLHYWISNTMQLQDGKTGIDITILNQDDLPVIKGAP